MKNDLILKIYKRTIIFSMAILGIIFLFIDDFKAFALGYTFGVSISMLVFKQLDISIQKSVKMMPDRAKKYGMSQYIIRMTIYAVVMVIAAKADYLNFLGTVLGLLMIKVVIVSASIFDKKFLRR